MRNVNLNILSAVDTGNATGGKIDANQLVSASFMVYFGDNTANGSVVIQGSNDPFNARYLPDDFTPTNWANLPNATFSVADGASGMILIPQMSYRWIRAIYLSSSGGSTKVNVNMNALSI